jgi:hypothetical protein
MTDYQCPRCAADPQPKDFGNPRRCAFLADGSFTAENWRCATIDTILDIITSSFDHDGSDESMQGLLCETEETRGWILLARYKHRGCTSSAMHFGDSRAEPLTLKLAEDTLAWYHGTMIEAKPFSVEDLQKLRPADGFKRIADAVSDAFPEPKEAING